MEWSQAYREGLRTMSSPEFDQYAEGYSKHIDDTLKFSGQDQDFFTRVKCRKIIDILSENFENLNSLRVLDVGCGSGITDKMLVDQLPGLQGVDVSPGMVNQARILNPTLTYEVYDGHTLPYADETFDFVFAICVMHHVPPHQWAEFSVELKRVTKKGGMVAVFEHNPLNPLTLHVVNRCEYDNDAVLLRSGKTRALLSGAGLVDIRREYILFFPFKLSILEKIEKGLKWLPLGAQYFVTARKR